MSTKEMVLIVIILALFATTIIFSVRSGTNAAAAEEAKIMSELLVDVLQEHEYPRTVSACKSIGQGRVQVLTQCLAAIRELGDFSNFFRETDFKSGNPEKNLTGYVVIQNDRGGRTFESEEFRLFFNNQLIEQGCVAEGRISPGFTCRFDVTLACEPGDNLEIRYEEKRAHLKSC